MWSVSVITAPATEPVTLAEAKTHLRVDSDLTADDSLITDLITVARVWAEQASNRALITQTLELKLDAWPKGDSIRLPRPPLQSVTSVKYTDTDLVTATMDGTTYNVDTSAEPGRIVLKWRNLWPYVILNTAAGIQVRYVAGYGAAAAVPRTYKQAVLLLIGHLYENREAVVEARLGVVAEVPLAASFLLGLDRAFPFDPGAR